MNIVIANAHWNNRGDEAAHRALWGELRRLYPDAEVRVLVKDRKSVEQFPDIPGFSAEPSQFKVPVWQIWLAVLSGGLLASDPILRRAVQVLESADLIIYSPGGSVINDRFFWSKQMEYLLPFLCARIYRIPMFVAAPSMGPFDAQPRRRVRKWLLQAPFALCVREDISRGCLEGIGIRDNVHVTTDFAFLDFVDEEAEAKRLAANTPLQAFLDAHEKVVGITITDFKWHVMLGKDEALAARIESAFREFIQWLVQNGYGVLLLPQLFGNQNDAGVLQRFSRQGVFVMDENKDTYFQQHVIGRLHSVVGMRYHSNIFAAKMGTPFIAIPYEEKMQGFLELAGLEDYALALDDLSADRLRDKFKTLEAERDIIAAKLAAQRNEWRSRAHKTVEILKTGCQAA